MTASAPVRSRGARRTFAAYLEAVSSLDAGFSLPPALRQQWLVMFAGAVAILAVLAGLYLDVSSRAAISGRDIQSLELAIAANERSNADLETQLASLLSNQTFEARAVALGYQPLTRDDLDYVLVPGYIPDNSVHLTMESQQEGRIANEPAFQQSLLEWIAQQLESASAPLPQ
ncbi:MAG: hypothetical protein CO094_01890 [Anaerolineae bacterium CG_4_9_14_3_um_filter_57_17]|nr:hypothetical protein [bacterium]NCT21453.1 hypothetical protein [bacterium]OIO86595.1 MAG: hypothetical protein AUK01_02785 [Anaerolineae bacterium CG2_30_57_67]PJB68188.1 MAG: hypothetical protein CO094_01890 [Anaerolineae bacterium CG_4_9_14_3_um_filter_57_17]